MNNRLTVVVVGIALFALVGASSAAALDDERVIRLYELYADDDQQLGVELDLGDKGESPGDMFLGRDSLYNGRSQFGKQRGDRVGHVDFQFTLFTRTTARVVATVFLPDGKIEVGGSSHFGRTVVLPVLGGTGEYANAGGTVQITDLRDRTKFVLRLFPVR